MSKSTKDMQMSPLPPVGRVGLDYVDDITVPDEDQTSSKVRRDVRTKLKIMSAMSTPSKTVFALTDFALRSYVRRYEATLGERLPGPASRSGRNVSSIDEADGRSQPSLPASELTTIRIRKDLRAELKVIAKQERKTLFELMDGALQSHIALFEAMAGITLGGSGD